MDLEGREFEPRWALSVYPPPSGDVTLAEVADKTVDHIASGVQQVAAAVEKLAPGAWELAVRKQRTEGAVDLGVGIIFLVVVLVVWRLAWRSAGEMGFEDSGDRRGVRVFISGLACIFIYFTITCEMRPGLLHLLNPEYFAARDILSTLHP